MRIPGIGNSFEGLDPRVGAQLQAAKELGFHGEHLNLYLEIEAAFPRKKPTHIINPEATGAVVITGTSTGIGRGCAVRLDRAGVAAAGPARVHGTG